MISTCFQISYSGSFLSTVSKNAPLMLFANSILCHFVHSVRWQPLFCWFPEHSADPPLLINPPSWSHSCCQCWCTKWLFCTISTAPHAAHGYVTHHLNLSPISVKRWGQSSPPGTLLAHFHASPNTLPLSHINVSYERTSSLLIISFILQRI